MGIFKPLPLSIALRYSLKGARHRFASFVALLSLLGILIGVSALIIVSSVMQGLQSRLKTAVLTDTPHVIVQQPFAESQLQKLPHVIAQAPYLTAEVLLQAKDGVELVTLQGLEPDRVITKDGITLEDLKLTKVPRAGSYALCADGGLYYKLNLLPGEKVRLLSTVNAKLTPLGYTPQQRLFTLDNYLPALSTAITYHALANFEDVRRLMHLKAEDYSLRLWLDDPFCIEDFARQLQELDLSFTDWRESQGEFFKAVAMERVTMSLMLCLIVLVAAFNILSSLSMMVSSRLKEIAVLKTLGLSESAIRSIFVLQGFSCGALGSLGGVMLGIPLALYADPLLKTLGINLVGSASLPTEIDPYNLILIITGSLLLSLISTLYPSYVAAKADPVEYLAKV
ncbi:MAG: FtsX-like permease family protein [Succinivibrio sp.]|nr:FtsX-like permease family protein [Succinivibrio sp.]